LREAAKAIMDTAGKRNALRDAFGSWRRRSARRSQNWSSDGDFRVRARSISAVRCRPASSARRSPPSRSRSPTSRTSGLHAVEGRRGRPQGRIRDAKRRDDDRAKRQASGGTAPTASPRRTWQGARRQRRPPGPDRRRGENDRDRKKSKKDKKKPGGGSSVLDRLGY